MAEPQYLISSACHRIASFSSVALIYRRRLVAANIARKPYAPVIVVVWRKNGYICQNPRLQERDMWHACVQARTSAVGSTSHYGDCREILS
jgi:hypothetical protein